MKRRKKIILALVVITIIAISALYISINNFNMTNSNNVYTQTVNPTLTIIDEKENSAWQQDIKIDYKYAFTVGIPSSVSSIYNNDMDCDHNIFGGTPDVCFSLGTSASGYTSNSVGVIYENVGTTIDGQQIDLKIEVESFTLASTWMAGVDETSATIEGGYIGFDEDRIDVTTPNLKEVKLKLTLLEGGTETPIQLDGFISLADIDSTQFTSLASNDGTINTWYLIETDPNVDSSGGPYNTANWSSYSGDFDPYTCSTSKDIQQTTGFYDVSNHVYTFIGRARGFDSTEPYYNGYALAQFEDTSSFTLTFGQCNEPIGAVGFYIAESPLKIELPTPVKSVSTSKVEINEDFTYTITQAIPSLVEDNYYYSYTLTDTLNEYLQAPNKGDITVTDRFGNDVTSNFDITVEGQTITAKATSDYLDDEDFYGNTFKFVFSTKVIDTIPVTVFDDEGNYTIPNYATSTITYEDGSFSETTQADVDVTVYKDLEELTAPTKAVSENSVGIGKDFDYTITQAVPVQSSAHYYTSFVITDTLQTYLQAPNKDDITVIDENDMDVTSWFDITVEGQTIKIEAKSTYLESSSFYGQTYTIGFTTQVKSSIPDSVFDSNMGSYTIPNYATTEAISGSTTDIKQTNVVHVTVYKKQDLSEPSKLVSRDQLEIGEEFTYTITQIIPYQWEGNYYESYVLTDTLQDYLAVVDEEEIKVYNRSDIDVTDNFNIIVEGQTIKIEAKSTYLDNSEFYAQTYEFIIPVKVVEDIENAEFDEKGRYTISNDATSTITYKDGSDGDSKKTNIVEVTVYKKLELPAPEKTVSNKDLKIGDKFIYTITQEIPYQWEGNYYELYVLTDTLQDYLEVVDEEEIKVYVGEEEVTSNFTITVEDKTITISANNTSESSFYEKTYRFEIPVKVVDSIPDDEFDEVGNYTILNQAISTIKFQNEDDGEDRYTNFVYINVHKKLELPTPEKITSKEYLELGEEFTYTITQIIPYQWEGNYYSSYTLIDTIEDYLEFARYHSVKVYDKEGNDVTANFNINISGQTITITANNTDSSDFYDQMYEFIIPVKVVDDIVDTVFDIDGNYIVPNQATSEVEYEDGSEGEKKETEIVEITVHKDIEVVEVPLTFMSTFKAVGLGILLVTISGMIIYIITHKKRIN